MDSRRKITRNTLNSVIAKATRSNRNSHDGAFSIGTELSGVVSSSAAPAVTRTTASTVTRRSERAAADADMDAQGAPMSFVSVSLTVVTQRSYTGAPWTTIPNVYRPAAQRP